MSYASIGATQGQWASRGPRVSVRTTGAPPGSEIVIPAQHAGRAGEVLRVARAAVAAQGPVPQAAQVAPATPPSTLPGWILPAALAGGALVLFMAMRK
jgi:hypothetical protein